ncbi:MAG: MarR family transcriptional regulator [Bacteroidales bacterium]|nr:MarR family transcriptional regulator [Bacteroidales bacterium]
MTVKDIFDLRKQGRIEEAYDAIRPMYAVHKGRYTTLCMFWTAADVFKLRLEQDRTEEAEKILEALKRMQPRVEAITKELDSEYAAPAKSESKLPWEHDEKDEGESAAERFIQYATRRLEDAPSSEDNDTEDKSTGLTNLDQSSKENNLPDFAKQEKETPSQESSDTNKKSTRSIDPNPKQSPKENNLQDLKDLAKQEKEPQASYLTVSLEDGIIRPIEGINAPQRVVLACLVAHPGYSIQQIADSTGLPAPSVERHIEVLIARDLVEQSDSEHYFGKYNNV